eukprot:jgi/Picre1/30350/NNA_005714.t1
MRLEIWAIGLVLALCAQQCHGESVLQLRYVWAPIFCYAGSSNGVPKEFCGEDASTARPRFRAHRLSTIRPLEGWKECSSSQAYSPSDVTGELREYLHCTSNSYTEGNDDGWHKYVWDKGAGCAAKQLGMNSTSLFQLMSDLYKKYDPDVALKKRKITLGRKKKIRTSKLLRALKKGFGKEGFITCDGATGKRYSTYSICHGESEDKSPEVSRTPKHSKDQNRAKNSNNGQRSSATVKRLAMYDNKAKRDRKGRIISQDLQSKELPSTRIQPDRRWFGNTRVIGQKQLDSFREEMADKMNDPYSVLLKEKKLPLSLVEDPEKKKRKGGKMARASLVAVEPFSRPLVQRRRERSPSLVVLIVMRHCFKLQLKKLRHTIALHKTLRQVLMVAML